MATHLQDVRANFVSLVDRAAVRDPANKSEPRRFLLWKAEDAPIPTAQGGDQMSTGTAPTAAEDLQAAITKAQEAGVDVGAVTLEKLSAKGSGPPAGDDPTKKDDIDAADGKPSGKGSTSDGGAEGTDGGSGVSKTDLSKADPAVREALEKADEQVRSALAKAAAAEATANQERDLRVTREFVAKAEDDFGHLAQDPQVIGPVLKRAHETLSPEDYEALTGVLKAADEGIETGKLFAEFGKSGQPGPDSEGDTAAKLEKAVVEIRKADPNLSVAAAYEQAMRNDPKLQQDYLVAERGAVRPSIS